MELNPGGQTEVCLHVEDNLSKLSGPHQRAMYDYWRGARGDSDLPPVSAIDPLRFPSGCLPNLLVMQHDGASGRFRTRLTGSRIVDATDMDFTGRFMDEFDNMEAPLRRFRWAVQNRKPYWVSAPLVFSPRSYKRYTLLCLPFAGPDAAVTRLLFVFTFG